MKEVSIMHNSKELPTYPFQGEIWTCNTIYKRIYDCGGYINKLFIMHKQVYVDGKAVFDWEEIDDYAQRFKFEVIAQHDIPCNHKQYPYQEIRRKFKTEYFTDSTCYEIAYALYKGYHKIKLYGMDFRHSPSKITDGLNERLGVEYWLGRAHERNIKTEIQGNRLLTTSTGKPYAIDG